MDYKQIHDSIIQRAKNRQIEGYTEKHHIVPKCLGGTNDPNNLVELTAREHFIIHKLLCEIYPENRGILYAYWSMSNKQSNDYYERNYRVSNREYERLRLKVQKLSSELHKGKVPVIDENGNRFKVPLTHPDYVSGKLTHFNKGENNGMYNMTGSLNHFYGKRHTEETKRLISKKGKERLGRSLQMNFLLMLLRYYSLHYKHLNYLKQS